MAPLADLRDGLIESLLLSLQWKGSKAHTHPVLVLLQERNASEDDGWLRLKTVKKELIQEDLNLFFLLTMALSGCGAAVNSKDRRDALCKAFGVSKRSNQILSFIKDLNDVDNHTMVPCIKYMLSYNTASQPTMPPLLPPAPATPIISPSSDGRSSEKAVVSAPVETVDDDEDEDPVMPPSAQALFGAKTTPTRNANRKRSSEAQTPSFLLSPESRKIAHRTKHRGPATPAAAIRSSRPHDDHTNGDEDTEDSERRPHVRFSSTSLTTTSASSAEEEIIAGGSSVGSYSRRLDSLLLSPLRDPKEGTTTIELSRRLNGLLLTPSLSVLQARIDSNTVINDPLLHTVAERIISSLADSSTGLVELSFKDRQDKLRRANLYVAPQPRNGKKGQPIAEANLRKKWHRKGYRLNAFLDKICLDDKEKILVLNQYVEDFVQEYQLVPIDQCNKLTVAEAVSIREYVGMTTNALMRLVQALGILKPGFKVFPPQLKKAIAEMEKQSVPMDSFAASLNISKTKKKICMFLRCGNPPLLVERMIASAHVTGKVQPSIDISNYKNSNLIFAGLDRGGGDTYLGIRIGNRVDGNQAEFCYPLAVVEDASEDYPNLKATFFRKGDRINYAYQDLIDDTMHTIEVRVVDKGSGAVTDAQCVAIRLLPTTARDPNNIYCNSRTEVLLHRMVDKYLDEDDQVNGATKAEDRSRASPVRIPTLDPAARSQDVRLSIQLLRKPSVGFIGLAVYNHDASLIYYMFLFERPLVTTSASSVSISCNIIRGFPSHDGKCALTISGQSSASSVRPCLKCIAPKESFREPRTWMCVHRPVTLSKTEPGTPDEPLRMGPEYSNTACFDAFRMQTGDGMYEARITTKDKHICYSVVNEPCAKIDALKESGGPMHISAGIIDHVIADCRAALRTIDKDGAMVSEVKAFEAELTHYCDMPPSTTEEQQRYFDQQYAKGIETCRKRLRQLESGQTTATTAIQLDNAKAELNGLLAGRYDHATLSGFGTAVLLKKGAEELLAATTQALKPASTKISGESQYIFDKAIELTGARYRKEHGGKSLSNSHSLLVAQYHSKVASAVEATYDSSQLYHHLQEQVNAVMRMFRRLLTPAYIISVILKSQTKITSTVVDRLKDAVCDFGVAFREEFPDRAPYPKLHWLECILVDYGQLHGFIGRGSEEGFESAHNRLAWIKHTLFAMPFMKDRGAKMGQRYQVSLLPEFARIWEKLHPPKKERGPYKKRSAAEKESKAVDILPADGGDCLPVSLVGLVRLASGSLIYEAWHERHNYIAYDKATLGMKATLQTNPIFQDQHNPRLRDLIEYTS